MPPHPRGVIPPITVSFPRKRESPHRRSYY